MKTKPVSANQLSLADLRERIDGMNDEILALIQDRAEIVLEIARLKQAGGLPHHDPQREEEMLQALTAKSSGAFGPAELREVFKALFRASVAIQNPSVPPAQRESGERITMEKPGTTEIVRPFPEKAQDRLFATPRPRIDDFNFGEETAAVFDDMLGRSVPFYDEVQRMVGELAADFAADGTAVYDLGCSTCTTFLHIANALPAGSNVRFVGLDSSQEMLEIARRKLGEQGFAHPYELRRADLDQDIEIHDASVVLLVLTLQFVRPLQRDRLIRRIAQGMAENGCLILVEKVLGESSTFNRLFIKHYYEMKKRNGYSDLEISQKREALENVLIPYRLEENRELLRSQGFQHVDVFFKWYNFCGIVAMK